LAAVQCAVEIQNELAHENNDLEKDRRTQFRIGINVGDVMLKDGDIFGDGVNIAARLEGLADAGGICISRGIHDQVMKKLPFEFEDLGEQSVKNIAQPVRVYRLILDGRASDLQSSQSGTPAPEAETDISSLSEAGAVAPQAVEIEFWDSIIQHPRQRVRSLSRAISSGRLRRSCPCSPRRDQARGRQHAGSA
jgi:adenylate cyclase